MKRNLPSIPIAADLHARLTIAAAEHTPLVADVRERLRLLVEPVLAELASRFEARPEPHRPSRFCFCGGPGCSWHRVEVEIQPGGAMVAIADSVAVRVDEAAPTWRDWFGENVDAEEVERQLVADGRMPPVCACADGVECSCGGVR